LELNKKETNLDMLSKQISALQSQITHMQKEFEVKFQTQAKEIEALKKRFRIERGAHTTQGR
jgi:hypothetical protein